MRRLKSQLQHYLRLSWDLLRQVSGDADYDRYLQHFATRHGAEGKPLSRAAFFRRQQERKWDRINRCC